MGSRRETVSSPFLPESEINTLKRDRLFETLPEYEYYPGHGRRYHNSGCGIILSEWTGFTADTNKSGWSPHPYFLPDIAREVTAIIPIAVMGMSGVSGDPGEHELTVMYVVIATGTVVAVAETVVLAAEDGMVMHAIKKNPVQMSEKIREADNPYGRGRSCSLSLGAGCIVTTASGAIPGRNSQSITELLFRHSQILCRSGDVPVTTLCRIHDSQCS